jgi:hypothetical protein
MYNGAGWGSTLFLNENKGVYGHDFQDWLHGNYHILND